MQGKYLNTEELQAEMLRALEARARGSAYTQRIAVKSSGLFAHGRARTMCVYAQQRGLKVAYDHDGGWLVRNHVLAVEGDPVEVVSFKLLCLRYFAGGF
jgi:hypothetical protein